MRYLSLFILTALFLACGDGEAKIAEAEAKIEDMKKGEPEEVEQLALPPLGDPCGVSMDLIVESLGWYEGRRKEPIPAYPGAAIAAPSCRYIGGGGELDVRFTRVSQEIAEEKYISKTFEEALAGTDKEPDKLEWREVGGFGDQAIYGYAKAFPKWKYNFRYRIDDHTQVDLITYGREEKDQVATLEALKTIAATLDVGL
ncbi:MAG: hypothetical protein AAF741_18500 [Bacteroidota bacterium]